jgi:hypothetical protein
MVGCRFADTMLHTSRLIAGKALAMQKFASQDNSGLAVSMTVTASATVSTDPFRWHGVSK